MSFGIYAVGYLILIAGVAYLAHLFHIPSHYIVAIAVIMLGIGVVTGVQTMVGANAEVLDTFTGKGRIRYGGEIWNALSSSAVRAGQIVRITRVDGLTVWVEPV